METTTVTTTNQLIADFMQYPNYGSQHTIPAYDSDWNDLMPVVERIEELTNCVVDLCSNAIIIQDVVEGKQIVLVEVQGIDDRLNATYKAVVEFLKRDITE